MGTVPADSAGTTDFVDIRLISTGAIVRQFSNISLLCKKNRSLNNSFKLNELRTHKGENQFLARLSRFIQEWQTEAQRMND